MAEILFWQRVISKSSVSCSLAGEMGVGWGISLSENRFTQGCTYVPGCAGWGWLCSGVTFLGAADPLREGWGWERWRWRCRGGLSQGCQRAEFPFTGVIPSALWAQGSYGQLPSSGGHRMGAQGAQGADSSLTTQAEQTHPTQISVQAQAWLLWTHWNEPRSSCLLLKMHKNATNPRTVEGLSLWQQHCRAGGYSAWTDMVYLV